MEDYPRTLDEFEGPSADQVACRDYLIGLPSSGVVCPRCQSKEMWSTERDLPACVLASIRRR